MATQVTTYREAGRRSLAQARAELAAGDRKQASGKGWCAAAQMIKAAAQARGWPHSDDRDFLLCVTDLAKEAGDLDINVLFASAHFLYFDFYDDVLKLDLVARCLDDTEQFMAKLEALLDG